MSGSGAGSGDVILFLFKPGSATGRRIWGLGDHMCPTCTAAAVFRTDADFRVRRVLV